MSNVLRSFFAISLTYNKSLICCNSHEDKTFWKCIHLLKMCFNWTFLWLFRVKSVLPETWMISSNRAINQISGSKNCCKLFHNKMNNVAIHFMKFILHFVKSRPLSCSLKRLILSFETGYSPLSCPYFNRNVSRFRTTNLCFAFKNKNCCCLCHFSNKCALELIGWLIWLAHQLWLICINKHELVKMLLTAYKRRQILLSVCVSGRVWTEVCVREYVYVDGISQNLQSLSPF